MVERWVISSLEDIPLTFCQIFYLFLSFIITAWVSWAGSLPDQAAALGFVGVHLPGGESQLVHQTAQTHEGFLLFRFPQNWTWKQIKAVAPTRWQVTGFDMMESKIAQNLIFFGDLFLKMLTNMPALITPSHWPAAADDFRKSLQSSDICSKSNINFLQRDQKGRRCKMANSNQEVQSH